MKDTWLDFNSINIRRPGQEHSLFCLLVKERANGITVPCICNKLEAESKEKK